MTNNLAFDLRDVRGEVVDIAHLEIAAGEKLALVGDKHSGRAELFRILAGLKSFRGGTLRVGTWEQRARDSHGTSAWDDLFPKDVRRHLGVALEESGLLANVSLAEGLGLLFRFRYGDHNVKLREGSRKVVDSLCQKFSLAAAAHLRPYHLSTAERKLGAMARAFLAKPRIVLLENPSKNIEDEERELLHAGLGDICADLERTVIISTGDRTLAEKYCSRVLELREGKIHVGS